jgi:hypothetical protein
VAGSLPFVANHCLNAFGSGGPFGGGDEALSIKVVFADCTCVKAHIHFPVDWALLRDSAATLVAAIKLIHAQGLKHRMPDPASSVKRMTSFP